MWLAHGWKILVRMICISEPTIEIVSGDTLDIVGFTLAHELATSEGRLPYNVGDEFGYTGSLHL